jgi:hypothetical protein
MGVDGLLLRGLCCCVRGEKGKGLEGMERGGDKPVECPS